jgi:2-octaprenyl-6-methoxyphenol hydroxylase
MPQPLTALVHGAGPTGALAALALADAGWRVRLRDPQGAEALQQRSRAYAFNHSSQRLLERLALWERLAPRLVPFRRLELCDLAASAAVPFQLADLGPIRGGRPGAAVGWIGEHGPLMAELLRALQHHPSITLELGAAADRLVAGGADPPADLEVAADGGRSSRRAAAGIGVWRWPYRQSCLTVQVALRGSADDQAWELFRPEGPFAVLPLGGGCQQVVWSASTARCQRLEALGETAFLDALAGALPSGLEPDRLLDRPRAFPVDLLLARRLQRPGLVLVGESAHRCHPVGGQGLNLCWRDVAELHRQARRVAAGHLRAARLPAAYARRRWPDLLLTLAATDLLLRLFSNRSRPLLPLRRLGLQLLQRWAPLRRLSLAVMTDGLVLPW